MVIIIITFIKVVLCKWLYLIWTGNSKRKHKHGTCDFEDTYEVPESGFIFTPRKKAKEEHLHYQAIYAHVKRQAPRFLDHLKRSGKKWGPEVAKLRPHSGRATLITELMGEGLSTALSMKYASLSWNVISRTILSLFCHVVSLFCHDFVIVLLEFLVSLVSILISIHYVNRFP